MSEEDPGMARDKSGDLPFVYEIPDSTYPSTCRSCRATVYWIVTDKNRRMPLNPDGTSHFATCPQADAWRQKGGKR